MLTNFHKHIESFKAERYDLDSEQLWDQIEPRIVKKKKRKLFFLIFALSGFGILLCYKLLWSQELGPEYLRLEQISTKKYDVIKSLEETFMLKSIGNNTAEMKSHTKLKNDIESYILTEQKEANVFLLSDDRVARPSMAKAKDSKEKNVSRLAGISDIKMLPSSLMFLPATEVELPLLEDNFIKPLSNDKFNAQRLMWGAHVNVFAFNNKISIDKGSENLFLEEMNTSVSAMFALDYGIDFEYYLSNALSLSSGINLMQLNERFRFNSDTLITISTQTAQGEVTIVDKVARNVRHTNHSQFLQIPLHLKMYKTINNHRFNIMVGASYSYLFHYSGKLLNTSEQVAYFPNLEPLNSVFKQHNVQLSLSLGYRIAINDRWDFNVSYTHRRELFDNILSSTGSRQFKFNGLGMSIHKIF